MLSQIGSGIGFSLGWPRSCSGYMGWSWCAAVMLREGSLLGAQALRRIEPLLGEGTKMPAHLFQLPLSQAVIRHSSPESHHLWKARERGLRLWADHLTDSRQAPCPGDGRCWCTQRAQENTAMAVELGSAPISDCQLPQKAASEWSPLLRGTSCAHRRLGAQGSHSTRTRQSWQPHCPLSPVGPSGRALVAAPSPLQPPPQPSNCSF